MAGRRPPRRAAVRAKNQEEEQPRVIA